MRSSAAYYRPHDVPLDWKDMSWEQYLFPTSIPKGIIIEHPTSMKFPDVMLLYGHIYGSQNNDPPAFGFITANDGAKGQLISCAPVCRFSYKITDRKSEGLPAPGSDSDEDENGAPFDTLDLDAGEITDHTLATHIVTQTACRRRRRTLARLGCGRFRRRCRRRHYQGREL